MFEYHIINVGFGWNSPKITREHAIKLYGEGVLISIEKMAKEFGYYIMGDLQVDYYNEK